MRHSGSLALVSFLALGAACSAGSAVGSGDHPAGSGATTASGGKGGSVGTGGGGGSINVGGTATGGSTTGGSSTGGSSATGGTGTGGSGATGGTGAVIGADLDCTDSKLGLPALRLLTRRELENTLNDIFPSVKGQWTDTLSANSSTYYGFDNDAAAAVNNQMVSALYDTALSLATAVTGTGLSTVLPCSATSKDHACATTFVDDFGRRLFRRPVAPAEEARYLTLFDSGLALADFPTALKWVITGMIQSPYAVYRSEIGTDSGGGARALSPYEIASELSYTFSGTAPTADLLDKVASGTAVDLVATAGELLKTDNGKELVQHFFEAYLAYSSGSAAVRTLTDPAPATGFDFVDVAPDMLGETRSFISDVVMTNGGGLIDLLTSPQTKPSQKLATYYGFPAPAADGTVTRPHGIGVLAQGSFLSSHANVDASSPTQRGLFAYYRLMCQPKLTPPNGVPPLSAATPANTTRELYEQSHASPGSSCAGCHTLFDPIGFGFEQFDQGGRFRTAQNGHVVDPAASAVDMNGNTLFSFSNEEELATALANQDESFQCLSAYLATYAFGSAAPCLGPTLKSKTAGILEAYASLAAEPNFTQRNAP